MTVSVRVRGANIDRGHGCAPIKGGSFTFRSFHGPDRGERGTRRMLDRMITITLPAIDGEDHKIVPHMEVNL